MTSDAVLPGLLTTAVRLTPMQDGAMLYDAVRLSNADPALFDTRNWIEKGGAKRTPAGRGDTIFIEPVGHSWVLRHYRRHGPTYVANLITEQIAGAWRAAILARLKRSLEKKITRDGPAGRFSTPEWTAIEQAYDSQSALPAKVTPSQDSSISHRLFSWCRSRW